MLFLLLTCFFAVMHYRVRDLMNIFSKSEPQIKIVPLAQIASTPPYYAFHATIHNQKI